MFAGKRQASGRVGKGPKSDQETEPSRILKLKECCDMLMAGGYFRARIPSLSPFDKVVGGMVWAITASAEEVDVDILFQENSSIGERIKLSEQLVRALISMKCPKPLQSHQIQGLDYDQLFPIIQWLVRKVIETRLLMGDEVRQLSVSQFGKSYAFPEEKAPPEAKEFVADVKTHYKPTRLFKQSGATYDTEASRTTATLLEYGEKLYGQVFEDEEAAEAREKKKAMRGDGKRLGQTEAAEEAKKKAEEEAKKKAALEAQKSIDEIQGTMTSAGAEGKLALDSVGKLVATNSSEIRAAATDYEEKTKEAESKEATSGKGSAAQAHARQVDALKRKMIAIEKKISGKLEAYKKLAMEAKLARAKLKKKLAYKARVLRETDKLTELENEATNKELLGKLKALVLLNETLKVQEAQFKANCKKQRSELMETLKRLEAGDTDDETKRMREIEKLYDRDMEKLDKLRTVLARKNQEIARINRLIDEIPTRAELLQYERRFVELYELVSEKLVETRKYFAMYNTLNESYEFMQQEVKLLNSVVEGFPAAMKSKGGREKLLTQFQKILEGIDKQKEQVEKEYQFEKTGLDALKDKYSALLEKQRNYFKAVKEFQDECVKNEKLATALERISQKGRSKEDDD